jgi:hypothetical protein
VEQPTTLTGKTSKCGDSVKSRLYGILHQKLNKDREGGRYTYRA